MRGKGMKLAMVVERHGTPLAVLVCSAKPSEHRVAEPALAKISVPRPGRGRPRSRPRCIVADKGYDNDPMRRRLKQRGMELIAPYRCNSVLRRYEDRRKLRRYRKRWKIERSIAWIQNFRRVYVRYDRILTVYLGFVYCACLLIALRHL
jgi:transposase